MHLPEETSPVWKNVIVNYSSFEFSFLGLRVFMGKVRSTMKTNPESANDLAKQLHSIVCSNIDHPKVKEDLKKIAA